MRSGGGYEQANQAESWRLLTAANLLKPMFNQSPKYEFELNDVSRVRQIVKEVAASRGFIARPAAHDHDILLVGRSVVSGIAQ
jgi:hypothetical protein